MTKAYKVELRGEVWVEADDSLSDEEIEDAAMEMVAYVPMNVTDADILESREV